MTKRPAALILICLLTLSTTTLLRVDAASNVIVVPDNYPSISEAIAHAADGGVIYVRNGVYDDSAWIINKPLTICGQDVKNTIVNLTPNMGSIYSSYFNRSYSFPANAITINSSNIQICGLTITSTGGITGNGDGIRLVSNIITLGQTVSTTGFGASCSITGFGTTLERNTLNGDDWRMTGNNLTLAENVFHINNHAGIQCNNSYSSIYENSIVDGDLLVYGSRNTITHDSYDLLCLFNSDSNRIQGNLGKISLGNSDRSCSNNIVTGNVMKGPPGSGLWLGWVCNNNIFYSNYINGVTFCNLYGRIGTNNTFYYNMFVNNSVNVAYYNSFPTGGNFWNKGAQGNYWSDYNGSDTDNDGVGDTPYVIDSQNRDNHPLIAPFDEPEITIDPPTYNPPLDESSLPQYLALTPISTPPIVPMLPPTSDGPTQQPNLTNDLAYLLTIPDFTNTLILLLASALLLIAVLAILKLRKLSGPEDSN
jgi:nitrous oxidase accessory protein NosD